MGVTNAFFEKVNTHLPEFWAQCVAYLQAHKWLTLVILACLVCLVAVIITLIVVGCVRCAKRRKLAKAAAQSASEAADVCQTESVDSAAEMNAEEPCSDEATEVIPETAPVEVQEPETVAEENVAEGPIEQETTAESPAEKIQPQQTEPDKKYAGKWSIFRVVTDQETEEETYFFELRASNGEKLLSSEEYTSYAGAVKGIQTHKANIEKGNFRVTISKKGDYIFKLLSGKNTLLCTGENYPTKASCESAIVSTKRFAQSAVLDETAQDLFIKLPAEESGEPESFESGSVGKWIIESQTGIDGETIYFFTLYANNGEKLLSSEEYTTYIGAVNGIATHKKNIAAGNFRITLTKRGDYIYKLLNGNGQLLCLGEHYKTKRLCQNAVESVKRFAASSPMLTNAANK